MKLVKEILYEVFTDKSDPIEDLHIGKSHWFDNIKNIFLEEYFYDIEEVEIFMDVASDELEEYYQQGTSEEKAAKFCHDDEDLLDEFHERLRAMEKGNDPGDTLKANCRSVEGSGNKKDADDLTIYLMSDYPGYNEEYLKQMAYDWVGAEDESDLDEAFTAGSDPIRDMSIGLSLKEIADRFRGDSNANIEKISVDYFGDKKHIGYAYVLWWFFKYLHDGMNDSQRAFYYACESENYHGDREDIVEDRTNIANVLKEYFNIEVDPLIYNYHHLP